MKLDCLKQNCSNYGDSYDDSQKEIVPNSQSDYATSNGSGPDSEVDCHAKKFRFCYPMTFPFLFSRLSVCNGAPIFAGYSLKCYSRRYSEFFVKTSYRSYARFSNFSNFYACKLIHTICCGFIPYSFILWNILRLGFVCKLICNINAVF